MPKLTKRIVDEAGPEPGKSQTLIWDSEFRGFGLRISAKGRKTFVLQYRTAEGREHRMTVGTYGAMTVAEARSKAGVLRGEVEQGGNPAARVQAQRRREK